MGEDARDMLDKALEVASREAETFKQLARRCNAGPGREIFEHLHDRSRAFGARIADVHAHLVSGKSWDGTLLPEMRKNGQAASAEVPDPGRDAACSTFQDALDEGLSVICDAIGFFDDWELRATDGVEREFARILAQEVRGRYIMISDLSAYYEKSERWATDDVCASRGTRKSAAENGR